jgi:ribonuclease D
MVVGHETLVLLAVRRPHDDAALLEIPGCTPRVTRRFGGALLEAIARGEALAEDDLPVRPRSSRPAIPAAVRRRADALRAWRTAAATRLGLDPGFLFPQRLIDRLAADPPADLAALAQVEGMRRWRTELLGEEVLRVPKLG